MGRQYKGDDWRLLGLGWCGGWVGVGIESGIYVGQGVDVFYIGMGLGVWEWG